MVSARDTQQRPTLRDSAFDIFDGAPVRIARDERRMHVRAYNHWVSLLKGQRYPLIDDLDPAEMVDFGHNSVLLDFTAGHADPVIRYLGDRLREECGTLGAPRSLNDVPSRSLLSRLTDQYHRILLNRAPIGFEAEFISRRGHETLYRGILMPFSATGERIDYLYGVINWKELVDADTQARLDAELARVQAVPVPTLPVTAIWADGPGNAAALDCYERARERLDKRAPLASVGIDGGDAGYVLLVARRSGQGMDVVAKVDVDDALTRDVVIRAAD